MELITKRVLIDTVADNWRSQYPNAGGEFATIGKRLRELPPDATEADVTAIIDNDSWTRNVCEECTRDVEVTVGLGGDGYPLNICPDCLRKALELATPEGPRA